MPTLPVVVGAVGALLLLVGLVGGGFEFSGSVMPKVGSISRILCAACGAVLVFFAIGLGAMEAQAMTRDGGDPPAAPPSSAPPTAPAGSGPPSASALPADGSVGGGGASGALGFVIAYPGSEAYVFAAPDSASTIVTGLPVGTPVEIVCTTQGESVTSPITAYSSSLWNGVTAGGFIPDVMVDTGTNQATMPSCTG